MSFDRVRGFDWNSAIERVDDRADYGELRMVAMGFVGARLHVLIYTARGDAICVISLRRAGKREMEAIVKQKPDHISQESWDAVASPALDPAFIAGMKPAARARGPQKKPTKRLVSLRLDPDIVEHFRATGPGWQARINDTLRGHLPMQGKDRSPG